MHVYEGKTIKAGDIIATIGEGGFFQNAIFIAYRRSDSSGYTGRIYDGVVDDLGKPRSSGTSVPSSRGVTS